MDLEIVAVWSWKDEKLVSFEQVPDFDAGLDRADQLRKKYYSKAPARKKTEFEQFVEDMTWREDPNYEIVQYSVDEVDLETAKQKFVAEKTES